jgi:hypothetical protein
VQPHHARLVVERVRRDAQPGHHRPQRRRAEAAAGRDRVAVTHLVQRDHAEHDEDDARDTDGRQPLVQQDIRADGNERDAEPARDRVHDRVGAGGVRPPERVEVHDVQGDRAEDERQRARGHAVPPEERRGEREQNRRGHARAERQKREGIAAALGQRIPGGVKDRGREDERQRPGAHRRAEASITRERRARRRRRRTLVRRLPCAPA